MDLNDYKAIGTRHLYALQTGAVFKAVIQDICPGEVTIRFKDGEVYIARSFVLSGAHIGEESLFYVKENDFKGRIVLGIVKQGTEHLTFDMRV